MDKTDTDSSDYEIEAVEIDYPSTGMKSKQDVGSVRIIKEEVFYYHLRYEQTSIFNYLSGSH